MDKGREQSRRYHARNREKILLQNRLYYRADPEPTRQRTANWRKAHLDEARQVQRRSYHRHPEREIARAQRYYVAHREEIKERSRRRYAAHR